MFKRTNGYVLLTLLVLTGFAGRVTNDTLNSKERRLLIGSLKDTRAEFLKTVSHLSDRQLDYRPSLGKPSIRQYLNHIATVENALGAQATLVLKQPTRGKHPVSMDDTQMASRLADACTAASANALAAYKWTNEEDALHQFKEGRASAIKYIRTTTENVRAHTTPTASGEADVYQLYLGLCAHLERHTQQIKAIMESKGFPKE